MMCFDRFSHAYNDDDFTDPNFYKQYVDDTFYLD